MTEPDEVFEGSFDHREKLAELKNRHIAAAIPASKIKFKQSAQPQA